MNIPQIENATILIAEDDLSSFLVLDAFLKKLNVHIIHVQTGTEAVEAVINNSAIDFVLMDIQLPLKDGYTATKEIKAIRKNLPVVAQTAHALEDDKFKSIQAGCDDYLSKPINRDNLYRILQKYLG